jgi:hypothetical protein
MFIETILKNEWTNVFTKFSTFLEDFYKGNRLRTLTKHENAFLTLDQGRSLCIEAKIKKRTRAMWSKRPPPPPNPGYGTDGNPYVKDNSPNQETGYFTARQTATARAGYFTTRNSKKRKKKTFYAK